MLLGGYVGVGFNSYQRNVVGDMTIVKSKYGFLVPIKTRPSDKNVWKNVASWMGTCFGSSMGAPIGPAFQWGTKGPQITEGTARYLRYPLVTLKSYLVLFVSFNVAML